MLSAADENAFSFKWPLIQNIRSERFRKRFTHAQETTNWIELLKIGREARSVDCHFEVSIGFGGVHLVRVLTFVDKVQWLARVTIPTIQATHDPAFDWTSDDIKWMQSEIDTMGFLHAKKLPVPEVFTYDVTIHNPVSMPYMRMELVHGNSIRDLGADVPEEHREKVYSSVAGFHVLSINGLSSR